MDTNTIIGLVAALAAVAAAGLAYWGVRLQLDARRPLLTVTFGGRQESYIGTRPFVEYILHVQNDGDVSVHGVTAQAYLDGTEVETIGAEVNMLPEAKAVWTVRMLRVAEEMDPVEGHVLTARVSYSGRSQIVSFGTKTTLR